MRAIETASGEPVAEAKADAGSKADVLAEIGSLCRQIREALGDNSIVRGDAGEFDTFTAASIEAAQDYTKATDLTNAGRQEESLPFYESAVQRDPNFGLALSSWAMSLFQLGREEEATELWKRALSKMAL